MLKKNDKIFDANMEFPEFDTKITDAPKQPKEDCSVLIIDRLNDIRRTYLPLQAEVKQLKTLHGSLPKEYRALEFEKIPDFINKLRSFSLSDTAPQFGRCAILAVCFYFMFSSLLSALLVFVLCFIVTVGVSYLTDVKNASRLDSYYQEYRKLLELCPDFSPLYGEEETLNKLLSIAKEKHPQSLDEAISFIE